MLWLTIMILAIPFFYLEYKKEKLERDSKQANIDIAKHLKEISENSKK